MSSEEFDIIRFLKSAVAAGASDEHLKTGYAPFIRKNGFILKTNQKVLTKNDIEKAIINMAPSKIKENVLNEMDVDFSFDIKDYSRFRVNFNKQLGNPGAVIRNIPYTIPTLEELNLSEILKNIVEYQNGIIFVTGPTGSGKSTTIASLINYVTKTTSKHIITIEDPIEYVFNCNKSIVSQRQVGVDTASFNDGIKYALRQDPDIIFIGEIRDTETMSAALKASETGHLVLTTLHTNDAVQTINRVINMFDESARILIRSQLAETLRATIVQKLVYSEAQKTRFPACEILVSTPTVKDYIKKDQLDEIYNLINNNNLENMLSLNTSLAHLVKENLITTEEALKNSNDSVKLEQILKGSYQGTRAFYE